MSWCAVNVNPVALKHYPNRPDDEPEKATEGEEAPRRPVKLRLVLSAPASPKVVKLKLSIPKRVRAKEEQEEAEAEEEGEDEIAALKRQIGKMAREVKKIVGRKGSPSIV